MEGRALSGSAAGHANGHADGRTTGRVEALWTKRAHRGVMDPRTEATFVAGKGIDGNTCRSSTRQVTIIAREAWDEMMRTLGAAVDPAARRANVMVSGVALERTRGRVLRLGGVRIRVLGETRPCERMDEAHDGLRAVMGESWRGGVFGEVLDDGLVTVGDAVRWEGEA
ncbi:MAG: MOSC domain-containing protein [Gemmatimonadales bacterium]|nr:MOSC domain-containing protein [Gemmatimonadales bacterium]